MESKEDVRGLFNYTQEMNSSEKLLRRWKQSLARTLQQRTPAYLKLHRFSIA
ncbi:hypothetical protein F2Q69_00017260 [Brassica cretica]|uniref:Uncharacterized protein n=1 Tax=Brassica cretica TaxID=69181 RepID=A0A8S9QH75_BRACR|nr:hypothetical protein F2Q69_00017260 [Brassica cretica]